VLSGARASAEGLPRDCEYLAGDVRDERYVHRLVDHAVRRFGSVDVLVNAHGVDFHSDIESTELTQASVVMEVNLMSVLALMKHVIPVMKARHAGSIVNVASRLGQVAIPGQAVYSASKGGLIMLSRGAAIDHARSGIRVNVVAPGITSTAMIDDWVRSQPGPEAFRRALEESIPMGRLALPREVATATLFLASDESSYVTGAVLPVDGGYTAA
jgi:NAD(P)-dependent dehydrogenase (short-subunit alcohol dehydrogenase family)